MGATNQWPRPWREHRRPGLAGVLAAALAVLPAGPAPASEKSAVLIVDANSGRVLHESSADAPRHPASLAKMMTLYLVFERIEQGRLGYDTRIRISANAAAQAPSKLDLDEGEEIALGDAVKALITKSANDIAVAVAEHIAGSEERFARLMTQKARQLGMAATVFKNASGLPDDEQVTTARDMVTLALRLYDDFPRHYPLFATRTFTYKGESFRNHNKLLFNYPGVDGLKTGYTRASGFNLVASVHRGGKHVVGALFGGASASTRDAAMRTFLGMGVVKASSERTRQPSTPLVARARPGPDTKVVAAVGAVPTPERVPRPAARPAQQAARPAPAAAPAGAAEPPPAEAAAPAPLPAIEVARVRRVPLGAPPGAQAADEPAAGAGRPAAPRLDPPLHQPQGQQTHMPAWATASAGEPPLHLSAAPSDRPALFADPGIARGAAPSTLDAQAANLARGEPAVSAPALPPPPPVRAHAAPPASRRAAAPAAAGAPGGFHIQIGAFQSQAEAERKLAAARERLPGRLADRPAVTSQVKQAGKTFFRARYGGFEAQAAAEVCGELKRLKIDCLVVKAE